MISLVTAELGTKENPHPITPPVKDRIKGHYYIYNLEVRYWNGSRLYNKEKIKEKNKKYREKNKEKELARKKKYREKNKEKIKEKNKKYREKNKEKIKEKNKKYSEKNKEKIYKRAKEYREKNKEKINKRAKEYREKNKEKIKEYLENNKEKINKRAKEYREKNKEKIKEKRKKKYEKNKEKEHTRNKEYRKNNKEKLKAYYEKNKEKIYKRTKEYLKKRRKNDPLFRLILNTRNRVWQTLKAQNAYKNQRTMEYVNCSVAHLHNHIESQFGDNGMNWDNMGKEDDEGGRGWELDHRRPCASFDLKDEEQKYMCFHWTNLQPMWGQENREKLNKFDPETFRYKWIDREIGWVGIPSYLMN